MKQRFIEWELEQDPNILTRFNTGKLIDAGALRHVICNVDPPEGVSFEDTMKVLNEVAETVILIPAMKGYIDGDAAIVAAEYAKSECPVHPTQSDLARSYAEGWRDACDHIREQLENKL